MTRSFKLALLVVVLSSVTFIMVKGVLNHVIDQNRTDNLKTEQLLILPDEV